MQKLAILPEEPACIYIYFVTILDGREKYNLTGHISTEMQVTQYELLTH